MCSGVLIPQLKFALIDFARIQEYEVVLRSALRIRFYKRSF